MRNVRHRTIAAAVCLVVSGSTWLAGCGAAQQVSLGDPQLDLGRSVYEARCLSCHGTTGQGSLGPALGNGRTLAKYPRQADHRAVVAGGLRLMPKFDNALSDAEIDAVVRYTNERLGR